MNYLDIAELLHQANLKTIPVNANKSPASITTKRFGKIPYDIKIEDEDLNTIFQNDSDAIALLCGNGVECIDVDSKNYKGSEDFFMLYIDQIRTFPNGNDILKKCYIQKTPSGGAHIIYKLNNNFIENNRRWAAEEFLKDDKSVGKRVLIETRGKHGYCLIYPSPGYSMFYNELVNIQEISIEEKNVLKAAALVFNVYIEQRQNAQAYTGLSVDSEKLWDIYNAKTDIVSYLCQKGWTFVKEDANRVYLKRPDDGKATNAAHSGNYHKSFKTFIAHTSSTLLENEKPYDAFSLMVKLDYGGDVKSALRNLNERFKVDSILKFKDNDIVQQQAPSVKILLPNVELLGASVVDWDDTPPPLNPLVFINHAKCRAPIGVALEGSIGVFTGAAKSRKSELAYQLLKASVTGDNHCAFETKIDNRKKIFLFDTEQPEIFFKHRVHKIKSELKGDHKRLICVSISKLSRANRIKVIHNTIETYKEEIGLCLIDGYVDLAENYNDLTEAQRLIEQFCYWRDETKAIMATVIHTTSEGKMRGHVGTELTNKSDIVYETKLDKQCREMTHVNCKLSRVSVGFPSYSIFQSDSGTQLSDDYSQVEF